MLIDLHAHTQASDGTDTPAQLIAAARDQGLRVVAITDHDSTSGWDEAADAARDLEVTLVRGIELSCRADGISLHVLGYLHDPTYGPLLEEMAASRASREKRAERITERLAEDVPIAYDDVLAQVTGTATVGRPHIADALVANGVVASRDEAFGRYLYDASPYVVPHYAPEAVDGVRLIVAAGGVPVMAHPFAAKRGRIVADEVIEEMAAAGLVGLEAYHPDHTPDQVAHALDLARALGLFVTGSSDYHGAGKANRLGDQTTTPDVYEAIVSRATATPVIVGGRR